MPDPAYKAPPEGARIPFDDRLGRPRYIEWDTTDWCGEDGKHVTKHEHHDDALTAFYWLLNPEAK